jgi:hypothetical protein
MEIFERRQFEQAAVGEDEAAAQAQNDTLKADLHTALPGKIVSFDAGAQTAVVRPGIKRYFMGQGWKTLPDLMDVPVQFAGGGGFVLTFPVAADDECLILFSERAIDTWYASGGEQVPHEYRTHDLSDAFAILGVRSKPHKVASFSTSSVELRSLDGSTKIAVSDGDVEVKTSGAIKINTTPAATAMNNGVLTGAHPCPIMGSTHGSFGVPGLSPCSNVLAGGGT